MSTSIFLNLFTDNVTCIYLYLLGDKMTRYIDCIDIGIGQKKILPNWRRVQENGNHFYSTTCTSNEFFNASKS